MREHTHTGQILVIPCITVISLVNYSTDPFLQPVDYNLEQEEKYQEYKLTLSQQFTEILQFQTPISRRHLILIRLADHPKELYTCSKKAHFPRRLIPLWEQVTKLVYLLAYLVSSLLFLIPKVKVL